MGRTMQAVRRESEIKPKIIHLDKHPAEREQLLRLPSREDDQFLAGDLIWAKIRSFPCWPGLITVDPVSGKYSDRDKAGKKIFHFQYFGNTAYRGFTEGKVWKYEGKANYDQKLEQMKNELLSGSKNSKLKNELVDLEVKKPKNDWLVACEQADNALPLSRADRIKSLTFEYIGPRSKPSDDESSDEEEEVKPKSKASTPKQKARKSTGDLKRSASKASAMKTPSSKRKKKSSSSGPTDVYDFNESSSDEDEQPAKFELSSAKRAKGEFEFYAKQMRENVEKENPKLSADEIEKKLRRNWELMSEDMRNSYAPRSSSQFTNHQNGKEETRSRRGSLKRSLPVFTTEDDDEVEVRTNGDAKQEKVVSAKVAAKVAANASANASVNTSANTSANVSTRASRSSSRFKTPLKAEPTPAPVSDRKAASPASVSTSVTNSTNSTTNNSKSNSIKSKSSNSNQLTAEENGVSEDSLSCSSDEKAEQQKEQKEQLCAKCGKLDKGLVPCEGECLDFYHKECLYDESAAN